MPSSLRHPRLCAAKASLSSMRSISSRLSPAFSRAFFTAPTGPMPMILGSHPTLLKLTIFTSGFLPSSFAFSSDMTTTADAPSFMPEEFPAVTTPSFLNTGLSFASDSFVVPGVLCSSLSNMNDVFLVFTSKGTISSSNLPASCASAIFLWLSSAKASSSSLVIPYFSATFSAVSPMLSPGYFFEETIVTP